MTWGDALLSLFYPRCCVVCGAPLAKGEKKFCVACNLDLPRTNFHQAPGNKMEQMFWGKIPIERATALFFYHKGSVYRHLLYGLKYRGDQEIGVLLGRYMSTEIASSGFFDSIDVIVPVPLHAEREKKRGYNQSACIAQGVSEITGIRVSKGAVVRLKNTETQTHKSLMMRWDNVEGIFKVLYPDEFVGKHVLLVDDVITTGATTVACALAFEEIQGVRFSVLTLALAE